MIQKEGDLYHLICGICGEHESFNGILEAVEYKKNCGWIRRGRDDGDGWENLCPKCYSIHRWRKKVTQRQNDTIRMGDLMLDWNVAERRLEACEEVAGDFALRFAIKPLRIRFDAGERTAELYNEIMGIAL